MLLTILSAVGLIFIAFLGFTFIFLGYLLIINKVAKSKGQPALWISTKTNKWKSKNIYYPFIKGKGF